MKTSIYIVALGAVALAGCTSSGDGPNSFAGVAGGLAATAEVTGGGIDLTSVNDGVTAAITGADDEVTLAFTGGGLNGRSVTFEINDEDTDPEGNRLIRAAAIAGLEVGEDAGNLTALADDGQASFAGVVSLESGDFDNPQPGDIAHVYALYGATPGSTHTLPPANAVLKQIGGFVGTGTDGVHAEGLVGRVEIDADFGTGDVTGTITGLTFDDSLVAFGGGDVGFAATMGGDKATYAGTSITMGGNAATGTVEGGFFGAGAAETAGAIFAEQGVNVLIGGFRADRQ